MHMDEKIELELVQRSHLITCNVCHVLKRGNNCIISDDLANDKKNKVDGK